MKPEKFETKEVPLVNGSLGMMVEKNELEKEGWAFVQVYEGICSYNGEVWRGAIAVFQRKKPGLLNG